MFNRFKRQPVGIPQHALSPEEQERIVAENMLTYLQTHYVYFKGVRDYNEPRDRHDKSSPTVYNLHTKFIDSLLGKKQIPLREPRSRGGYKVSRRIDPEGNAKLCAVKTTAPQFTEAEKKGFSKKTAVGVSMPGQGFYPPVFNALGTLSTGILFFVENPEKDDHALTSLIFLLEGNNPTYRKFWVGGVGMCWPEATAQRIANEYRNRRMFDDIPSLIKAHQQELARWKTHTPSNEVLARLRFLPGDPRCHVGIFNDCLSSRLEAQLRAKDWAINMGVNYVPISFYDYHEKTIALYTLQNQRQDLEMALFDRSCNDDALRLRYGAYSKFDKRYYSDAMRSAEKREYADFCKNAKVLELFVSKNYERITPRMMESLTPIEKQFCLDCIKPNLISFAREFNGLFMHLLAALPHEIGNIQNYFEGCIGSEKYHMDSETLATRFQRYRNPEAEMERVIAESQEKITYFRQFLDIDFAQMVKIIEQSEQDLAVLSSDPTDDGFENIHTPRRSSP